MRHSLQLGLTAWLAEGPYIEPSVVFGLTLLYAFAPEGLAFGNSRGALGHGVSG